MTPEQRYEKLVASQKRWQRRLTRAANMVTKIEKQRQRLDKAILASKLKAEIAAEPPPKALPAPKPEQVAAPAPETDGLEIPVWLRRDNPKDEAARAEILADQAAKKKKRDARNKEARAIKAEMRDAILTGKTRRMPLQGKAALDAIRE